MAKKIQTFIFEKSKWSVGDAKAWLKDHEFRNDKLDETDKTYRFRQFSPNACQSGSFETLIQNFPDGVSAVACEPAAQAAHPGTSVEKRAFRAELRIAGDAAAPVLEGHAAVFNQLSEDMGGWREQILPGAFAEALQGDIRALWNHDCDLVLGRNVSGTLELKEDETGLAFRVTPPDTAWFRDRLVSLKRGDVTGCSFAFYVGEGNDAWSSDSGETVRTISKIRELVEVSPGVTFPAYSQTDVALASLRAWRARRDSPAGGDPNDWDAIFVRDMLDCCTRGVAIGQAQMKSGSHPALKDVAQRMIDACQQEASNLHAFMAEHPAVMARPGSSQPGADVVQMDLCKRRLRLRAHAL